MINRSIISVIEANWKLNLPNQMDLVYKKDTTGWFGDDDRYTVFKLKEELTEFIEMYLKTTYKEFDDPIVMEVEYQATINANLIRLNICEEYLPDWLMNYEWLKTNSDYNTIFIMYFMNLLK